MRSYALCERLAPALPRRAARRRRAAERASTRRATSSSSRCRRSASSRRGLRQRRPALHDRARVGDRGAAASWTTLRDVAPQVVLVELFPFGRAKFARELVPLLEQARARARSPPAACATSSSARANQRGRRPRGQAGRRAPGRRARALPTRASPASRRRSSRARRCASPSTTPASSPAAATPRARRGEHVVVSAGGGRVGAPLLAAAMEASNGRRCARSPAR